MRRDWLWDRRISDYKVKHILSNPDHQEFVSLAALLLTRKNSPPEVLKKYISPVNFCRFWPRIKKRMRLEKGMTQVDLAKKLNISQQIISRVEKGRENLSLDTLRKFVTQLGGKIKLEIK